MHEFAMATQIVENVLEEAKRHDAKKVAEVHLVIGKMTFLGVDQVRFSYDVLVKDTIMRKQPSFSEGEHGYRSFTELLEDAQAQGLITLERTPSRRTYMVELAKPKPRPRRSRRKKANASGS